MDTITKAETRLAEVNAEIKELSSHHFAAKPQYITVPQGQHHCGDAATSLFNKFADL